MSHAPKREKSEGGYACAGVLALSLAALLHFGFNNLNPEQVDELPPFLGAVYKAVGIGGVSVPLGVLGLGLIAREVFFTPRRRPVREKPRRVVVVRRPGEAATLVEADADAPPGAVGHELVEALPTGEPLDEAPPADEGAEAGGPADPGRPRIRGGWGAGTPNARRGRVTDASEPEKTTVVGSGGGQMQLSSAKYLKKKGGGRDAELAD